MADRLKRKKKLDLPVKKSEKDENENSSDIEEIKEVKEEEKNKEQKDKKDNKKEKKDSKKDDKKEDNKEGIKKDKIEEKKQEKKGEDKEDKKKEKKEESEGEKKQEKITEEKKNKNITSEKEEGKEINTHSSESHSKKEINEKDEENAEEIISSESEKKNNDSNDNNSNAIDNIVIEDENEEDQNKKSAPPRKRGRKKHDEEYFKKLELENEKRQKERRQKEDDSDIISIHEEEENIMNANYDQKSEFLFTPFGKLLQISKEYGFNTVMDRLINLMNANESTTRGGIGINKEIKDILKNINKDTLNLYLIKLLAYNTKKNFKILNDFKMSSHKKFKKYMKKIRAGKNPLDEISEENKISSDESDITEDKERFNSDNDISDEEEEEEDDDILGKKTRRVRGPILDMDGQYRSRHFEWKDGILHSYLPKICNLRSSRFYLYCWKLGCKGKIRIDMINKTAKDCVEHNNHRGIILENFITEYPELADKDWTNIQYDVKNKEKIFMWKIKKVF